MHKVSKALVDVTKASCFLPHVALNRIELLTLKKQRRKAIYSSSGIIGEVLKTESNNRPRYAAYAVVLEKDLKCNNFKA